MTKSIRKKPHSAAFKFKVALAAIKGDRTISQLCAEFSVVSSQIHKWKQAVFKQGSSIFGGHTVGGIEDRERDQLHATIGRLKVENDFLAKVLGKCP